VNPTLWAIASALGGGVLVALAIAYRRALARRELEEAEAVIAAEYEALRSREASPRAPAGADD